MNNPNPDPAVPLDPAFEALKVAVLEERIVISAETRRQTQALLEQMAVGLDRLKKSAQSISELREQLQDKKQS